MTSVSSTEFPTSETGGTKGVKPAQYRCIPPQAMDLLARQFAYGSFRYDDHNFRKGYAWSYTYDALMRHLQAFWGGEEYDEDGNPHAAAIAWHGIVLLQFWIEHPEFDDRWAFGGDMSRLDAIMRAADEAYVANKVKYE